MAKSQQGIQIKPKISAWIGVLSLAAFFILAGAVLSGAAQQLNLLVYQRVALFISPALTKGMILISNLGQWFVYLPISLLFLIIPRSRVKIGLPVSIAISASALLNTCIKQLFALARPEINRLVSESGYGFPSGHAMNGTVFIGLCAYLFIRYSYKRPLKITVFLFSFFFMLLMGLSRIYLGVHYFTDILGGYLAGIALLATAIFFLQKKFLYR